MANRSPVMVVFDDLRELIAERDEINAKIAEVKDQSGLSKQVINTVLKRLKMDPAKRDELDALVEITETVLGVRGDKPLGEAALRRLEGANETDQQDLFQAGQVDELFEQAKAVVLRDRKASTSYIQRRLQIGYNLAAALMARLEQEGVVGPANHAGKREILLGEDAAASVDVPPAPEPIEGHAEDEPDVARAKGGEAFLKGVKITANPYAPRSPQRAAWDEGWCAAAGSDGMDIPAAFKPTPKPKKPKPGKPDEGAGSGGDEA